MRKFLVLHYNPIAEACLNLLAEQPRGEIAIYLADPRPLMSFRSAIRKFKRLMITYFIGKEPKNQCDYEYHYVVLCGEETTFSKEVSGKRITPKELAKMFPGEWADALLRIQEAEVVEEPAAG